MLKNHENHDFYTEIFKKIKNFHNFVSSREMTQKSEKKLQKNQYTRIQFQFRIAKNGYFKKFFIWENRIFFKKSRNSQMFSNLIWFSYVFIKK